MNRPRLAMLLCAALLAQAAPRAIAAPPPAAASSPLLACLIQPERVADLGSPVVGVIEEVMVDRGAAVKKGQVLARLHADVERANSGVARSRADSEGELRAAGAARDLAQQKLDRARSLAAQNFVSGEAVQQAESEFRIAREKMQSARDQLGTSAREVSSAQAQLSQRVVRAPFDGVITERYLNPGERIEDKPLLRIATIQQLRVEVVASTAAFGLLRVGQELSVQPDLAGFGPRNARITQIDSVLEPASNTFRVRLDLPNLDASLPAGLRCKAALGRAEAPPAVTPAIAPAVAPAVAPAMAPADIGKARVDPSVAGGLPRSGAAVALR